VYSLVGILGIWEVYLAHRAGSIILLRVT
jgi:hypothetical protein